MSASMLRRGWGQPAAVTVIEMVGDLDETQHEQAMSWLTTAERERYDSEPVGRAERFLAGRWLLRMSLAQEAKSSPTHVTIVAACTDCGGEHGAPLAHIGGDLYHVSLSHTKDAHVAAVSRKFLVGIDIEGPRVGVDLVEWTAQEALSKLDGSGLREPATTPAKAQVLGFRAVELTGAIAWAPSVAGSKRAQAKAVWAVEV